MTAEAISYIIEPTYERDFRCFSIITETHRIAPCMFIVAADYEALKQQNMWRIVQPPHLLNWLARRNIALTEVIDGNIISEIILVN